MFVLAFSESVQKYLHGSSSTVKTALGATDPIPLLVGIKQKGCPLILALQGLLTGLNSVGLGYTLASDQSIYYLAYANNLCVLVEKKVFMLGLMDDIFLWAGLEVKPSKCAVLSCINGRSHRFAESFSPNPQ